jgi:hypothetical protein
MPNCIGLQGFPSQVFPFSFCKFYFIFPALLFHHIEGVAARVCRSPGYRRRTDHLQPDSHRMPTPLRCIVGAHCSPINNLSINYHHLYLSPYDYTIQIGKHCKKHVDVQAYPIDEHTIAMLNAPNNALIGEFIHQHPIGPIVWEQT